MSFKDITGVFSRYFIAGFFLPAFFGLLAASLTVARMFDPIVKGEAATGKLVVLAFAALLVALLLLVLRLPIIRLFEGYPLESLARRGAHRATTRWDWVPPALRPRLYPHMLHSALVGRQDRRRRDLGKHALTIAEAGRQFDRSFVPVGMELLPSRLGNVIRAFEYHGTSRWGLTTLGSWPRIAALISERERELHVDAETDLAFCLNSCVATALIAMSIAIEGAAECNVLVGAAAVIPALLAWGCYLLAIPAAVRWGVEVRASVDLNRLEMYRRLGLSTPPSFSREREMAGALSRFLDYGGDQQLPDMYWGLPAD